MGDNISSKLAKEFKEYPDTLGYMSNEDFILANTKVVHRQLLTSFARDMEPQEYIRNAFKQIVLAMYNNNYAVVKKSFDKFFRYDISFIETVLSWEELADLFSLFIQYAVIKKINLPGEFLIYLDAYISDFEEEDFPKYLHASSWKIEFLSQRKEYKKLIQLISGLFNKHKKIIDAGHQEYLYLVLLDSLLHTKEYEKILLVIRDFFDNLGDIILQDKSTLANIYILQGISYFYLGQIQEAENAFQSCIAIDPSNIEAQRHLLEKIPPSEDVWLRKLYTQSGISSRKAS